MKRVIFCIIAVMMVSYIVAVPVFAEAIPTAKITATLVGDTIPQAGEKFTVAISVKEISSGLFASGQAGFRWSTDVASLVDYYEDVPTVVTDDYCLGNIYNEYAGRTGKFTYIANFDRASVGEAVAAIYIPLGARNQSAEVVSEFTMFEIAFTINEGYTYDDFYLTLILEDAVCFLTADKQTVSKGSDGKITVESIESSGTLNDTNATSRFDYINEVSEINSSSIIGETLLEKNAGLLTVGNMESNINAEINLLYNDTYSEAILEQNNTLNAVLTIANCGTSNKNLICYIAEYDAEGCMLSLIANNTIAVTAGETVKTNISKTFSNSNTAYAKIFVWENGSLVSVTNSIELATVAADYYSDIYTIANLVETNKQICGLINVDTDVDIVKFQTTETGIYVLKFSGDNGVAFTLYDSEQNVVNTTAFNGIYKAYNLLQNQEYYIKMTGNANNNYHIKPMSAENLVKNLSVEEILTDVYDCDLYAFTPEETGEYIITAVGTDGVKAALYNSEFEQIALSDIGDGFVSFRITYNMEINRTYYITVEQKPEQSVNTSYALYVEEPFDIVAVY